MADRPDRPMRRTRLNDADLAAAWREHSSEFIAWARAPGHDSYWRFHRDIFLDIVPPPGRRTLDLGCGEGRVSRDLAARGHSMVGIDVSPAMVEAARRTDPSAGSFQGEDAQSPFAIQGSYLDRSYSADELRRDGIEITFLGAHRPIEAYADALAGAGLLIERLREPRVPESAIDRDRSRRWQRVPLFLHMRAVKAAAPL